MLGGMQALAWLGGFVPETFPGILGLQQHTKDRSLKLKLLVYSDNRIYYLI